MFLTQPVTLIPYLTIAFLVRNILAVCSKIDRTKYDVVMDMPLVYVDSQHMHVCPPGTPKRVDDRFYLTSTLFVFISNT